MRDFLLNAWIGTATAAVRALDSRNFAIPGLKDGRFYPINPMVQASHAAYDHSRYEDGAYDRQVTLYERRAGDYGNGMEMLDILKRESRTIWKAS